MSLGTGFGGIFRVSVFCNFTDVIAYYRKNRLLFTVTEKRSDAMTSKKNQNRMYCVIAQFCYEHKKMDSRFCKIRKNAKELAKMLDALSSKKEEK